MRLQLVEFPSNMFHFANKAGSADASDMGNRHLHLQQIYNDACDCGFAVRSSNTDKIITYSMTNVQKDREGDILYWVYEPISEDVRKTPECAGTIITVFND